MEQPRGEQPRGEQLPKRSELTRMVEELRAANTMLREEMAALRLHLQAPPPLLLIAPAPIIPPPAPVRAIPVVVERKLDFKLPTPSKFKGERSKLRDFLAACSLVLDSNPSYYVNDMDRVIFVASLLEGPALSWYVACRAHTPPTTFKDFREALELAFGDPDRKQRATMELQRVRQGSRPLTDHIAEFRMLALESGLSEDLVITFFVASLHRDLAIAVATHAAPHSLNEAFNLASGIDTRINAVKQLQSFSTSRQTTKPADKPTTKPWDFNNAPPSDVQGYHYFDSDG